MKNEIKEILDKINCALKIYERDKKLNQVSPKSIYFLSPKEQQILLDYITNLQEENKQLKEEMRTLYKYTPEKGFRLVGDDNE